MSVACFFSLIPLKTEQSYHFTIMIDFNFARGLKKGWVRVGLGYVRIYTCLNAMT